MKYKHVGVEEDLVKSTHAWVAIDLFFHTLPPLTLEKIFSLLNLSFLAC